MGIEKEDIDEIAHRTADEVMERIREREHESMLLNSVPYAFGSPGIVINEEAARAGPCRCVEYKAGKRMCWSSGIIGALSGEQKALYCASPEMIERPGTVERMRKWQEAVDTCKVEIAPIPKGERLEPWLLCMGRELRVRGMTTGPEVKP